MLLMSLLAVASCWLLVAKLTLSLVCRHKPKQLWKRIGSPPDACMSLSCSSLLHVCQQKLKHLTNLHIPTSGVCYAVDYFCKVLVVAAAVCCCCSSSQIWLTACAQSGSDLADSLRFAAMDLDMYVVGPALSRQTGGARRRRHSDDNGDDRDEPRRARRRAVATATAAPARPLASQAVLRVATLCSGIEAVIQGHEHLRIPHVHVAACDKDKHVQRSVV